MLSRSTSPRDEADVVVVGAGPSGSTAAAMLGELGHEVLVVDKDQFPREKACGDGIMHPAVAMAERLGLASLIEAHWEIEVGRVIVGHRRQSITRFVRSRGRPLPRCIGRADFDAALLGSARERGARVLHARVDEVEESSSGWRLHAVAGGESLVLGARVVVAADGATSRLRRSLGGAPSPPLAYAVRQYFVSSDRSSRSSTSTCRWKSKARYFRGTAGLFRSTSTRPTLGSVSIATLVEGYSRCLPCLMLSSLSCR